MKPEEALKEIMEIEYETWVGGRYIRKLWGRRIMDETENKKAEKSKIDITKILNKVVRKNKRLLKELSKWTQEVLTIGK